MHKTFIEFPQKRKIANMWTYGYCHFYPQL